MFRRWVKAVISAEHLPGLCGSKDPLESEREKGDTSSAFMLQTCQVPTLHPSRSHAQPKESNPSSAAGRRAAGTQPSQAWSDPCFSSHKRSPCH